MMKQNSNAIHNMTDTIKALVAGQSKPKVQTTSPPRQGPMQPQPVPASNGNNEECLMQHCFKVHEARLNREQAEQTCQADGGHLVMAKSAYLYDFVVRMKNQVSRDDQFWFGAKFTDDRVWLYPDGTPVVDAVPWAQNEPNDHNNYKCSHIVFGNKNDPGRKDLVADAHCSYRLSFICERTTADGK
ncbi:snaclec 7-like [Branchiostoma floridae]|nr:snaclec 7-like [Branchiostoma floridae]